MAIDDINVKTLAQVLMIAKTIIENNKEKEFLDECAKSDEYFVVATDKARVFVGEFINKLDLQPHLRGLLQEYRCPPGAQPCGSR